MRVLQNNDTCRVTCRTCKSELAVEVSDVRTSDIGHPYDEWINCCVCGATNEIPNRPKRWTAELYKDDPY